MDLLASLLFAQQSNLSLGESLWRSAVERWRAFETVFVGEDLLLQAAYMAGCFVLAYGLALGLRPLLGKLAQAAERVGAFAVVSLAWVRANLYRLILVLALWSVSLSVDAYHHDRARQGGQADPAPVRSVVVRDEAGTRLTQTEASSPVVVAKNYILLRAVASAATLWLVSGALPQAIRQQVYFKSLFFVLAIGLILNLLGVWSSIRDGLNGLKVLPISEGGETQVTALTILKGLIAVFLIIPLAGWLLRVAEARINGMQQVSPALRALIVKVVKTVVVIAAGLFAISSIGVNLGALAILGGAVGLGLGFGLQKVVSNLVSGVILLADRSIKPGDVIEVDDTYGWINKLGARYASVVTRDGTEHLIPNETLITEKVTNWSFSDDNVRIKVPFGVAYQSDIHLAMKLSLEAAVAHPRVLKDLAPAVRLMGFGDNSVDFELRVWICDPAKGVNNLRSDIYVALWDLFKANGVEFPFPQRDLHIRDSVPLELRWLPEGATGSQRPPLERERSEGAVHEGGGRI